MDDQQMIERYRPQERMNHWVTAIMFVMLALSGLALFHPAFFFLTNLFGGGAWTRILHPYFGIVLALSFGLLARRFWTQNRITAVDNEWMRQIRDVLAKRDSALPEAGRYNGGQKYLFWTTVLMIALLLISGVVIWQPWFAPLFPVTLLRIAVLVHALAAFVLIAGIIVHIYAAIWVKGSIRAMTRGTVTAAWAKQHHAAWYRETGRGAK
ncbi:MAG: formate dehydrogenase subunit gamma [Acidiferrobacterales bacterium]